MKVLRILSTTGLTFALGAVTALPVSAQVVTKIGAGLRSAGTGAGYQGTTTAGQLPVIIGSIISTLLSFVGVLLLCYLIYAGFLWMTAGGDKTKVSTATTTIRNAIIGLVIIMAAYAIADFVLTTLTTSLAGGSTTTQEQSTPPQTQ